MIIIRTVNFSTFAISHNYMTLVYKIEPLHCSLLLVTVHDQEYIIKMEGVLLSYSA